MAKTLNINYNGKTFKAEFDRASARLFAKMGYKVQDVWENPLVAVVPFVFSAFKKHQPSITEKKAEEVYDALPKNVKPNFLNALVEGYIGAIEGLVGSTDAADGDEGNATWENPDEDN